MSYVTDEDFKKCPFKLELHGEKPLAITANIQCLNEVARSMQHALSGQKLDFSYMVKSALVYTLPLKREAKRTAESIAAGEYEHQGFDVAADLRAPILIVPEDIFESSDTLRLELGRITLASELQDYKKEEKGSYKTMADDSLLYDRYGLALSGVNLSVLHYTILDKIGMEVDVLTCLDPMHPKKPSFKVDARIRPIKIELPCGLGMLKNLVELQTEFMAQLSNHEYNMIAYKAENEDAGLEDLFRDESGQDEEEPPQIIAEAS
jgi:hypothetical protein